MSNQTSCILNKIFESEKFRWRNVDENKDSTIQKNDKVIIFFNQQFRDAKMTMLHFQNLQRARLLKQQTQNIATKVQAFRSDSTESELFEMFNLKNAGAKSTNAQSLTSENLNKTAIDALLSQIFLSFKFKIIEFEKMRAYKN